MMLGRVDEVDGHFIATRFIALIIPAESFYVSSVARPSRPDGEVRPRVTNQLPIRLDWRSVGLAYARVWLPVLAIATPVIQTIVAGWSIATWILGAALGAAAWGAHRAGQLPEREKARLRLLGTVTGLRVDPSKLRENTRATKRGSLGDLMEKAGIPLTPSELLAILEDIPMPALPLVYGYACYAGDDPEWRETAAAIHARYEQGEL